MAKKKPTFKDAFSLQQRYHNFWRVAQVVTRSATPEDLDSNLKADVAGDAIIIGTPKGRCLELVGIPVRAGTRAEMIDIRLSFRQVIKIENDDEVVTESAVEVTYLRRDTATGHWDPIETWHYDYEPNKPGHPIFHAQITGNHILAARSGRSLKPPSRSPGMHDLPRVPTPPMDLAAVMGMLVNDHLPEFAKDCEGEAWKTAAESLPKLSCLQFKDWIRHQMQIGWWYP